MVELTIATTLEVSSDIAVTLFVYAQSNDSTCLLAVISTRSPVARASARIEALNDVLSDQIARRDRLAVLRQVDVVSGSAVDH